jgi:hypothetical protein
MKKWIVNLVMVLMLGGAGPLKAVVYNDGNIHDINSSVAGPIDVSAGPAGSTTLNVLAGGLVTGSDAIGAADTSAISSNSGGIVNILDGAVSGGNASGDSVFAKAIYIKDGGTNISGGTISGGDAGGNASANAHAAGIAMLRGTLNITGGTISGGDALSSSGNAHTYGIYNTSGTIDISGGTISVGNNLGTGSDNTSVHGIYNNQNGIVNISGGLLLNGYSASDGRVVGISNSLGGVITIYGTDFNLPYGEITGYYSGHLTGILADGSLLDTKISNGPTSPLYPTPARIVLVAPVPEPSTFVLLGMGVFGLCAWTWRRNRKSI